MPTRILLRLCFWVGLMAPLCAFALGVGPLEVRSTLNQTFEAELPLMVNNPAELTGLAVRIPRQEEFDRTGVERLALFSKLRFAVQTPPGGRNVVKITSVEPIREPNFNLLLEVVWPRGRLIREFPVQLDPELYANRKLPPPPPPPPPVAIPAPVAAPPVAAAPAVPQLPPAPPVNFEGASFYGPVLSGETLTAVANRVRPSTAVSIPQMMAILIAGNPAAFNNGNPNTLRVGATLKVPTPQALGMQGAPATNLASVPPPASELAVTPSPVDTTAPSPVPVVVAPEPAMPLPPPVEPASTPPPTAPPAVTEAPPVTPLPPAEPLQEIVPRAAVPEPEPLPAPVTATPPAPETVAPPAAAPSAPETVAPPAAAPPAPETVAPPPAVAPAVEVESESWMSNPVVWLAILLIALAIAAMVLLPLLRRPARPKSAPVETATPPAEIPPTAVEPPSAAPTSTQAREPRSVRPRPAAGLAAGAAAHAASTAAATPGRIEPVPSPAGAAKPRPIEELLKDFDFGAGEGTPPAARQGAATPARDIKAPLLEAEPPTASVTRRTVNPFAETPTEAPESGKETPSQLRAELPSELRLDGLDFDFGDLGLDKTARPPPSELPALEMKPVAAATVGKPVELPPLELGIAEPATEPPSLASTPPSKPTGPRPMDLKFEFTDVTQELSRPDAHEDALNLDDALQGLGGDTLKLGGKADAPSRTLDASDYVETKLDLASAYLDMGDQVGARSLLEDVMQEGSAAQKERAGALLKKLG